MAKPADAVAQKAPASTPLSNPMRTHTINAVPVLRITAISPLEIPSSISFAMRNGIRTSMITSTTTKTGVRMQSLLYSRIDRANFFIIVSPPCFLLHSELV